MNVRRLGKSGGEFIRMIFLSLFPLGSLYSLEDPVGPESAQTEAVISAKDEVALEENAMVADTLKRRSDLSFSNIRVDGEESSLDLTEISAHSVDHVEVIKAVLPDMDADARGGSLNIRSKPLFLLKKPDFKARLIGKYYELFTEGGVDSVITYATALDTDHRFGLRVGLTTDRFIWGNEQISQRWSQTMGLPDQMNYSHRKETHDEYQLDGALDIQITPRYYIYFRGSEGRFEGRAYTHGVEYGRDVSGNPTTWDERVFYFENGNVRKRLNDYEMEEEKGEWSTGGFYDGTHWFFDYRYRRAFTDYRKPDDFSIDFLQDGVDFLYDLNEPTFPKVSIKEGEALDKAEAFIFEDLYRENRWDQHDEASAFSNLKWIFDGWDGSGFLKAGVKWRQNTLDRQVEDKIYERADGDTGFKLSDVLSDYAKRDVLEGHYFLDTLPGYLQSKSFFDRNEDDFILNERRTRENSDQGTFLVEETLNAAYLMGSFERGPFRVLAGYRIEETTIDYRGQEVLIDQNGDYQETNTLEGTRRYENGFPSFYTRFRMNERITWIGSITYTIKRPDFGEVVPRRNVDIKNQLLNEGNPELKPTLFTNYDVSLDYKLNESGLLTIEGFYKEVEDLVFSVETRLTEGTYAGYDRRRLENSGSGSTQGLVLTWDQNLDLLRFFPDGFGFNLQYRYEESTVAYPNRRSEGLPFTNTPEQSLLLTLRYKWKHWYAHIRIDYQGEQLNRVDASPSEDIYRLPSTTIDLNVTHQFTDHLSIDLEVNNLLSEPANTYYEGVLSQRSSYLTHGRNVEISLRWQM